MITQRAFRPPSRRPAATPIAPVESMPASSPVSVRPVVLLILDGFGCREATPDNAIARARKPNWDRLLATCPHTSIDASELAVGLPDGQMGNSEVGHLNMGAGRVVYQDLTRIDLAIRSGEFAANPVLRDAAATAAATGNALHILGLLSPGGVHSHERHIAAMVELAAAQGVPRIFVHAFLDGRDTPPQSALASLVALDAVCARHPGARIASIVGRYYAMDRDKRWDRVRAAYELLVDGSAAHTARLRRGRTRGRLCARRERRIRRRHRDRRRRREAGDDARRRHRRVHEFSRRPGARDHACTDRPRVRRPSPARGCRSSRATPASRATATSFRRCRSPSRPNRWATASASTWPTGDCGSSASRKPRNTRMSPTSSAAAPRRPIREKTGSWSRRPRSPLTISSPK